MHNYQNKTLPLSKQKRKKRVATGEDPNVVSIPDIVGIVIVRIEPRFAVIVPLDVEHVQIAIGIGYV